jgi:hypothetical protein
MTSTRSSFRSCAVLFFAAAIVVAALLIPDGVLNPARAESPQLRTVYLHDTKLALYRRFTEPCVRSLKSALVARSLKVEVEQGGATRASDAGEADIEIALLDPINVGSLNLPEEQEFAFSANVFRDPTNFAHYLESNGIIARTTDEVWRSDPLWLGSAYGATSQIFTADKPAVEPAIINKRAIVESFATLGHSFYTSDFDLHYTFIFDVTGTEVTADDDSYKAALNKFLLQNIPPERLFILQPLAIGLAIVPPKWRTYVSLANWHVMPIYFALTSGGRSDFGGLVQAVRAAAASCGEENFQNELKARHALEAAGSTFVPVDLDAYQALKLRYFQEKLAKAQTDFAAGKTDKSEVENAQFELDTYNKIQSLR